MMNSEPDEDRGDVLNHVVYELASSCGIVIALCGEITPFRSAMISFIDKANRLLRRADRLKEL